jgi:hypothetical protein
LAKKLEATAEQKDTTPTGSIPVESLAQWLRTLGYGVKAPEAGPPDDQVQVTIDENGHIHLPGPPPALRIKHLLLAIVLGYIVLGLIWRAKEATGMIMCSCAPDCWCQKPGVSISRWVFPHYHRNPELAEWKKQLD